jgi:hypothetical protein
MFVLRCALASAILLAAAPVHAEADPPPRGSVEDANPDTDTDTGIKEGAISPGVLPTLAAVVPGLLIHGSGHYVGGDKEAAVQLLKWQAIGLSLAAASGLYLRLSGGSRYGNELTIPMLVSGSGLMINTFVADVFGSAGGGTKQHFKKPGKQAASIGYGYINDPQFSYRHFTRAEARLTLGSVRAEPLLWVAMDDDNQRARLPLTYRILGNAQGETLEASTAFTYHHFGSEDFSTYVSELNVGGRVEMQRLGESLRGSFSTMSVGLGLQVTSFNVDGLGNDIHALLLAHFGYGFYLPRSGELEGYYEHRRDTFTAGSSPGSRNGSGFLGHFGLKLRQPIHRRIAIKAIAEIGSAYLVTSGLEITWDEQ